MNFTELAKNRRSIRAYEAREINREELESCIEVARFSPSACHSQPWRFVVVDDPATKNKISETFSGTYSMNTFARDAAAFVVIVAEKMKFPAWAGNKLRKTDFRRIDIGIACAHIVLRARELGIGTCILGWFNEKKLKKILSVPYGKRIELVISMGYPTNREVPEKVLKDKAEVLGFNSYRL